MTKRYTLVKSAGERDVFEAEDGHTIHAWPVYQENGETRYTLQDSFLYTWSLSGPEYLDAQQYGIDH